jgi:uncharacterized protein YegP (UPF0339 family)
VALITSISKFQSRLKAGNSEIIAAGETYESKASTKNRVESVLKNAAGATVVDLTEQPEFPCISTELKPSPRSKVIPTGPAGCGLVCRRLAPLAPKQLTPPVTLRNP